MNWVHSISINEKMPENMILEYTGVDVNNAIDKEEYDDLIVYIMRPSHCFYGGTFFQTFRETPWDHYIMVETGIPHPSYFGVDTIDELKWEVPEEWEEILMVLLSMGLENLQEPGLTAKGFTAFC